MALPPKADERPQLLRWIGVRADGSAYPTSQRHSNGFELSEPFSDEIPPAPWRYYEGRDDEPK